MAAVAAPSPAPSPELGRLDPDARSPLGAHSVVRSLVANPLTPLLVQRALVMEVAHPAVAAGVEHHSRFRQQPLRRAWATADAALRLIFGDDNVARGVLRQIYGVHDHINGPLVGDGPDRPAAVPGRTESPPLPNRYSAHEASLLMWVWATLVDTAETAHTRWIRAFTASEASAFYAEMRGLGRFIGIPDRLLPADRDAFSSYLETMLADRDLGAHEVSRRAARQVLWFRHWTVPPPLVRLERVLALATLDDRLVGRLDLRPAPSDVELGRRIDRVLASCGPRLPRPPRIPGVPAVLPALYVLLRRPTVGLSQRLRPTSR